MNRLNRLSAEKAVTNGKPIGQILFSRFCVGFHDFFFFFSHRPLLKLFPKLCLTDSLIVGCM